MQSWFGGLWTAIVLAVAMPLGAAAPAEPGGDFDFRFGVIEFRVGSEPELHETIHIPLKHEEVVHGFILTHRQGLPFKAYMRGTLPREPGARGPGLIWDGNQFSTPVREYPGVWVFAAMFDHGDPEGELLVVGWGSTRSAIEEAVERNPDRIWPHLFLASSYAWGMTRNPEPDKALAALERARELAEETARAQRLFLTNMNHELRTPLNGVLGMLELLRGPTLRVVFRAVGNG